QNRIKFRGEQKIVPFIWAGKAELSDPMQRQPPASFPRLALARYNRRSFRSSWHCSRLGASHHPRTVPDLPRIRAKPHQSFAVFLLLFRLRHAGFFLLAFGDSPPALPKWNDLPWEHLRSKGIVVFRSMTLFCINTDRHAGHLTADNVDRNANLGIEHGKTL